ncbi:MAG: hypothetical protein ABSE91_01675 [Patescibacteria group bacterium]|jgi:hypothetical protein
MLLAVVVGLTMILAGCGGHSSAAALVAKSGVTAEPPEGAPRTPFSQVRTSADDSNSGNLAQSAKVAKIASTTEAAQALDHFTVSLYGLSSMNGDSEITAPPGCVIFPWIHVRNMGTVPITGIKIAIRSNPAITVAYPDDPFNKKFIKALTTSGVPLLDGQTRKNTIGPYNSKYYRQGAEAIWSALVAGPSGVEGVMPIQLSKHLMPGTDEQLRFTLIYKGAEKVVAVATVHVMHPE